MRRQHMFPQSTIELLVFVKGTDSDQQLADKLGVDRPHISLWRKRGKVSLEGVAKLAELGGYDLGRALALRAAEGIPDERYRKQILKKLATAATHQALTA